MSEGDKHPVRLSRRAAILGTLAPVTTLAGTAPSRINCLNSVSVAVNAHRRAVAELTALMALQEQTDRARRAADPASRQGFQVRLAKLLVIEGQLSSAEMEAADLITKAVPRNLFEIEEVLRYVRERFEKDGYEMYEGDGYRALLLAAECAICNAVGLPAPQRDRFSWGGSI